MYVLLLNPIKLLFYIWQTRFEILENCWKAICLNSQKFILFTTWKNVITFTLNAYQHQTWLPQVIVYAKSNKMLYFTIIHTYPISDIWNGQLKKIGGFTNCQLVLQHVQVQCVLFYRSHRRTQTASRLFSLSIIFRDLASRCFLHIIRNIGICYFAVIHGQRQSPS